MQKEKSTFGWVFAFAGQKRSGYIKRAACGHRRGVSDTAVFRDGECNWKAAGREQGAVRLYCGLRGDGGVLASAGELKNILVERVDSIEPTLAHVIPEMSSNAVVVLATLAYLFALNWRMALASLITLPLGMVFFMLMMLGYEKNYARTINIMPATLLTVLPIGGLLIKNGTLTPEKFVLVVVLSMGLITPIIGCMKYTDDLAKVGTIISQVTDILTAPELPRPAADAQPVQGSTVALHGVRLGYNDAEVLHGIDLTFREGTVNALVGPSGSGKSTIAKLIAAFWDVKDGSITVGGADIRSISAAHYNRLVAYVSQDNFLFDDTVRENIRMGRPDATDAEVEQAARDCGCYDFIMGLENGFDTRAGSGRQSVRRRASAAFHCPRHNEGRAHHHP